MKPAPFDGFPEGKMRIVPLPGPFFSELLPQVDHLGELKVVLYTFWRLSRQEGKYRFLRRDDFAQDATFLQGLASEPPAAQAALDEGLERAVRRGALLRVDLAVESESGEDGPEPVTEALYFLNSAKGRAVAQAIRSGAWRPSGDALHSPEWIPEPPNIFRLYEENIGPLTPMISEMLTEAEETYPATWIEEALRIAVENNKRSWRYVTAILDRWQLEGREERAYERKDRRDSQKDRRRYAEWNDPD